ncbi:MAG: hypothetical protein JHC87_08970, partial [Thermoleophilaceae bacterium]|nr:hypothetical protein [Thermoleophilaceae bacterium]
MTLQIGIALALICAFITNLGFLLKYRGACEAPAVNMHHPLRSAAALFRSRYFLVGYGVAVVAFAFHVAALWLAPISVVQSVISGGLVFLAVIAEKMFGYKLAGRQWAGIMLTAAGMMLLAITLPRHSGGHGFSLTAMIAFEAIALCVGLLLMAGPRFGSAQRHTGVMLGAASGVLIGVSDIAIKAMTDGAASAGVLGALLSPWCIVALVTGIVSFYSVARGLQLGDAVPVITMIGVSANLV